jgi:hypothetical protein
VKVPIVPPAARLGPGLMHLPSYLASSEKTAGEALIVRNNTR